MEAPVQDMLGGWACCPKVFLFRIVGENGGRGSSSSGACIRSVVLAKWLAES